MNQIEKDKAIEMSFVAYRPSGTITEEELKEFINGFYVFMHSMGLIGGGGFKLINSDGSGEND